MPSNSGPIDVHRFDTEKLVRGEIRSGTTRQLVTWNDFAIDEPGCWAGFQEVRPGDPLDYWVMWFDELQYVLAGQARLLYRMPPSYSFGYELELKAGDLFNLPVGCDFTWEVRGEEPFRTVIVAMPRPQAMK